MVSYYKPAIKAALEITKDCKTQLEKYNTITEYISHNFAYDYIRAITIPKMNGKPDVPRTWKHHIGICIDIAALTTMMLRALGLKVRMCYGKADRRYHAWVEARIDEKNYRYDFSGKADKYETIKTY